MTQLTALTTDPAPTTSNLIYTARSGTSYQITVASLFAANTSFDHILIWPAASSTVPLTLTGASGGQTADLLQVQNSAGTVLASFNSNGILSRYNNLNTAALGLPIVVKTAKATGASPTTWFTYTPSADGLFRANFRFLITSFGSGTTNVRLSYTDKNSNAITCYLFAASSTPANLSSFTATGEYIGYSYNFRAKGSNSITLELINGTGVVHNYYAFLEQIST